jgi:hypothetical protein
MTESVYILIFVIWIPLSPVGGRNSLQAYDASSFSVGLYCSYLLASTVEGKSLSKIYNFIEILTFCNLLQSLKFDFTHV